MASKKKQKQSSENEPNLIFVGLKLGREPITKFTDHDETIVLPPANEQVVIEKKGDVETRVARAFYHKDAEQVVRVLGSRLYKLYETREISK